MEKNNSDIFIISGEKSGDIHGSYIIENLLKSNSSLKIDCWGGPQMENAGGNILENYSNYSVMGFVEVLYKLPLLLNKLKKCKKDILRLNPKLILLIDFPGFNLKIAKFAKRNGFNVHYYIPPKVWAWNPRRISILKKYVDKIYSILPFEKKYFLKNSLNVDYVGNPIMKKIDSFSINNSENLNNKIISLLPGSRIGELKYSLPIFKNLVEKLPNYTFNVCGVSDLPKSIYDGIKKFHNVNVIYENTYDTICNSAFSVVMSGTASLEVALLGVPQIVVFKISKLSYLIGKLLIKVNFISLVNLILSRNCVKELIQDQFNTVMIVDELKKIENNVKYRNNMIKSYSELRKIIGRSDASVNVSDKLLLSI